MARHGTAPLPPGSSHPWGCHDLRYPPETLQSYILAYPQHQLSGMSPGCSPGSGHRTSTWYLPFAQQTRPTGSAGAKRHLLPVCPAWPKGATRLVSSQALKPDSLLNRGLVERSCLPSTGNCPPRLLQTHAAFFQALSAPCTFSVVKHPR